MASTEVSSKIVKFASLMCAESCIMTGLNLAGYDYRPFILEFWNLIYEADTLMAGRKLSKIDLEYVYGIKTEAGEGDLEQLIRSVSSDRIVLVSVYTSRLSYFPQYEISFDSAGFRHQVVIYGYCRVSRQFRIIDPIAGYEGTISPEHLMQASIHPSVLAMWSMEFPTVRKNVSMDKVFNRASAINLSRLTHSERALDEMKKDLMNVPAFDDEKRSAWIDRNNLGITTIIHVRQSIWRNACSLDVLTAGQIRQGSLYLEDIIKQWSAINFLLIKFKRNPRALEMLRQIHQRLDSVQRSERLFLENFQASAQ